MNVDWVIPCRYVEVHDNLGTLVGAGIDTFWVPEVPAPLQLVCAIRLTATADELGSDHQHHSRTVITGPDGEVVADIGGEFGIDTDNAREDWLNGFVLPMAIAWETTAAGSYQLEHIVDGTSKSIALHVIVGTPNDVDG
jgi:hypothetical protein